jgi:catechol 2,3-dioxygenase-like lactoylglutathione lyase family enzyme
MPSSTQTPIQTQHLHSIALTVKDCDRARHFYTQALGFQVIDDTTYEDPHYCELQGVDNTRIRIMTLQLGDERIRFMEYLDLPGQAMPEDSRSNDGWFQHFAIAVRQMDRAHAHLQNFPIQPISRTPQTIPPGNEAAAGVQAYKFKDPEGHNLELIHFPADKGQDKWHRPTEDLFLGIDHTAIVVSDTEQSLRFYRDLLGLEVDGGSLNWRETQSRIDNLPNARVRVTPLRPARGGLGLELLDYLEPANGRPRPADWTSADIPHVQTELVVNDLSQTVHHLWNHEVPFVSPSVTPVPGSRLPHQRGCLVRDPDSHAVLLMEEEA